MAKKMFFLLLSFSIFFMQAQGRKESFVKTDVIKLLKIYDSTYYGSRIEPINTIKVYSSFNGIVEYIRYKEGDRVARGTVICSIRRKLSSDNYQPAIITSGASGIIVNMKINPYMEVFDKSELFAVADDSKYKAVIYVSDKEIQNIKMNDVAYIKSENSKNNSYIEGVISKIAVFPDNNKGLFEVEVSFVNKSALFIGKFVTMELRSNVRTAIAVPQKSIIKKYGKSFIYTISDNTIKLREVKVGGGFIDMNELLSGVTENEMYVVNPTVGMNDGDKINTEKK